MSLIDQFIKNAVRQIGRDAGKVVSNQLFGDAHSTPVRGVGSNGLSFGENKPSPEPVALSERHDQAKLMNATIRTSASLEKIRDLIREELALLETLKGRIREEGKKIKGYAVPVCMIAIGVIFGYVFALSRNPSIGPPKLSALMDTLPVVHQRLLISAGLVLSAIGGFLIKFRREKNLAQRQKIAELQKEFAKIGVTLNIETNGQGERAWEMVRKATEKLFLIPEAVWDTRDTGIDRGTTSIERKFINPSLFDSVQKKGFPVLNSSIGPIVIPNLDGPGMRLYPGFVLYGESIGDFHLIDYNDLHVELNRVRFTESEIVPRDTRIIDRIWLHTNKNGTRDKRYSHNPQLPVCEYGKIKIAMSTFHSEDFLVSRLDVAQLWYEAIQLYRNIIVSSEQNEPSEAQDQLNSLLRANPLPNDSL